MIGVLRKFGKKKRMSAVEVLYEFEEKAPVTSRKLDPIIEFVKNIGSEDEIPAALALKLLILRYSDNPRLIELLRTVPERLDRIEKPSVLIDSYKYAAFIVAEIEKRISELPYSDEKRKEILSNLIAMIQGILYVRAIQKAKSPTDLQRIADAFFVPRDIVEKHWRIIQRARQDQRSKRKGQNFNRRNTGNQENNHQKVDGGDE